MPGQFQCPDKNCIPYRWVCDSRTDCLDGSDENDCKKTSVSATIIPTSFIIFSNPCDKNQFRCKNNFCISEKWYCDGISDCLDGSDEKNCALNITDDKSFENAETKTYSSTTTTYITTTKPYSTATTTITSAAKAATNTPYPAAKTTTSTVNVTATTATTIKTAAKAATTTSYPATTTTKTAAKAETTPFPAATTTANAATIFPPALVTNTTKTTTFSTAKTETKTRKYPENVYPFCGKDQYPCSSAGYNCLWLDWFCDGVQDCLDNSDEMNC